MNKENRKKIYRFFDYNPYDYRLYLHKIFDENQYEQFCKLLTPKIDNFYQGYKLQELLKSVPSYPVYRTYDLEDADCLLISHEPGSIADDIDNLYKKLTAEVILLNELDCAIYIRIIDILNDLMEESMISWLAMNTHIDTGEINGDKRWTEDNLKSPWKELGKLGYFFDQQDAKNIKKCLHFDLFPYGKEFRQDPINKEEKQKIYEIFDSSRVEIALDKIKKSTTMNDYYTANFIIHLFDSLKSFLNCNKGKYICIIANSARVVISQNKISYNINNPAEEHGWVVYKVVEYIKQTLKSPVEIRFINRWPSKCKKFEIYQYLSLDVKNKEIILQKIREYNI